MDWNFRVGIGSFVVLVLPFVSGCSSIDKQEFPAPESKKEVLEISKPEYTFAPANRGHAYYKLLPGKDLESALNGESKFRISGAARNGSVASSKWIKLADFQSGLADYDLNTGFQPEDCSAGNEGARLALTIESKQGLVATINFVATNNCSIDFFNLLINGE